jgi:DNA-binding protein HU-beta
MNKSDLVAAIAAKTGDTKKSAEEALNAFVDAVTAALVKGEKVQLVGFGSFEVRKRAARKGRNPQTKEEIKIPASKAPVFKAGKALKDLVNNK